LSLQVITNDCNIIKAPPPDFASPWQEESVQRER
jgi:hypothetical protein